MSQMSENKIIDSILDGIKKGQNNCKMVSNSLLRNAPEYMTTVYIYQSLSNLIKKSFKSDERDLLEFEKKYETIKEYSDNPPRIVKMLPSNIRCDLVLWHNYSYGEIRAIIEVKKDVKNWKGISKDVKRLAGLAKGLKFAISASAIYEKAESKDNAIDNIKSYLTDKKKEIKSIVEKVSKGSLSAKLIPDCSQPVGLVVCLNNYECNTIEKWYWQPVCFKIYHKKNLR